MRNCVAGQLTVEAKPATSVSAVIGVRAAAPKIRAMLAKAGSYSEAAMATPSTTQNSEIEPGFLRGYQADEPKGADQRSKRHHHVAAEPIDQRTDIAGNKSATEQADGKAGHGEGLRPAPIGRNQGDSQHRRVEQRAPGENLRDPEHGDGAPGTNDEVERAGHIVKAPGYSLRACCEGVRASSRPLLSPC